MKYLEFPDGKKIEVIGEDDRFFVTKSARFRKISFNGKLIDVEEEKKEKAPAKKPLKKAKEKE